MKVDELKAMMLEDSAMDGSALDVESLKTPLLHGKWYGLFLDESRVLRALKSALAALKLQKLLYYTGRADDAVYVEKPLNLKITKQDFLDHYHDADPELVAMQNKVSLQEMKVKMLDDYIKSVINARSFHIKDAIAFIKFKNGVTG